MRGQLSSNALTRLNFRHLGLQKDPRNEYINSFINIKLLNEQQGAIRH